MNCQPELSRFRIIGQLGRGGTAEVHRVFDDHLGREAALKRPLSHAVETEISFADLARREWDLIGGLTFPGLVRIIDPPTGECDSLLLELCHGPTLDSVGRIEALPRALNIIAALALDLEFLRTRGIAHGDLKPHNVFLPSDWDQLNDDRLFYVKLSDFSLGCFENEPVDNRIGHGTVGYMAPETVTDAVLTHRSDLFALGIIAYQVLTGRHPFITADDSDPVRINGRVREESPEPLGKLLPDLDDAIIGLVERLLSKSPADRPQTAWEVCQILDANGACYPYRRALRPRHLIDLERSYKENIEAVVALSDAQRRTMDEVCEQSSFFLRLISEANLRRGNLDYQEDGRFAYRRGVYMPHCLRRAMLEDFQFASLSDKRGLIDQALLGGPEHLRALQGSESEPSTTFGTPVSDLILPLLRSATVRRRSARFAPLAEKKELLMLATRLFVQAGDLEGAERCAYQAAVALDKKHEGARAVRLVGSVIELAEMRNCLFDMRQLLMTRGDILKHMGDTEQALISYQKVVDVYCDRKPEPFLAEAFKAIGDLYKMKQNFKAGLEALNRALNIYREVNDELKISNTLNNIGNIYWVAGDYSAAVVKYREALRIQKRLKSWPNVASTVSNIGAMQGIMGRFKRAIYLYEIALRLMREIGDQVEIGRALNNFGYIHNIAGHNSEAVACLKESLEINRRVGSQKEVLYNLENLTSMMITAGQLKKSIGYVQEGITLAEALSDIPHRGVFLANMGTILRRLGRFREAREAYLEATAISTEVDDELLRESLAVAQAAYRLQLGDLEGAHIQAVDALRMAEKSRSKPNQLDALLLLTRIVDGQAMVSKARELAADLGIQRERLIIECNAMETAFRFGRPDEASEACDSIEDSIKAMRNDIELPRLCNLLAEIKISRSQPDEAMTCLERGGRLADTAGMAPEMVANLTLRGRVHVLQKDYEQGYACYRRALQTAKEIATGIEDESDRRIYQGQRSLLHLVQEIKEMATVMGGNKKAGA